MRLLGCRGHQRDGEKLQGCSSGGLSKLHPGDRRHGGYRDHASMSSHTPFNQGIIEAWSLHKMLTVFHFFVNCLTHLALRLEQVHVVRGTTLHREELEGHGREAGRRARWTCWERMGGVHGCWHLVREERGEGEVGTGRVNLDSRPISFMPMSL